MAQPSGQLLVVVDRRPVGQVLVMVDRPQTVGRTSRIQPRQEPVRIAVVSRRGSRLRWLARWPLSDRHRVSRRNNLGAVRSRLCRLRWLVVLGRLVVLRRAGHLVVLGGIGVLIVPRGARGLVTLRCWLHVVVPRLAGRRRIVNILLGLNLRRDDDRRQAQQEPSHAARQRSLLRSQCTYSLE